MLLKLEKRWHRQPRPPLVAAGATHFLLFVMAAHRVAIYTDQPFLLVDVWGKIKLLNPVRS